ncbi:serine/threonine protein kinase [Streptoalloteichus tenebrarius]|uniref:non-specific serine/threonine protein kinase n=1 Tax=Streptoalloteichus tenebrarius (strain ATCC 17920 / DSM 40477 / JCM 4838 / CBS 697.72 / NBRC 16177 / NCIMB 11028 / NRRL B-12390 / A12253. 1 / ISP 5477) TaxID=1933 RepID=A0ABT1I3J1_STRSD|nr:Stk1 family PASTA domain-containing Ser/Thr kinase [Streptoalloteichus tenebrarius]MCP2262145.1 serine/threonine protein kinase [Streptoalloteichus tenebrarius]BFF01947.1 Stk1 family PASTA domain-containing Ser/Thr kinase [Streptoalloteichus tenebrarius]
MTTPRLLSNRYELGDTLGYGGMSEVHRGRDVRLGRDVAVKVLRADLARDPQFQLRFRREAQNAAALNHPAIVAVYDTGETETDYGPLPYIVMEFVDGRTLRDMIKSEGPLPPRRAMEIMADVCAALDFSHRHGIVHRDVKPANIMITRSGAVKVMDFGIARAVADGQAAVTQTAAVIGTAQYLSPEQARGETVDARSDVYATGCVLFELLTGEPPFTGDSPVAVAYQHVREDPRTPSEVNSQIPTVLDAVVLKAMSKNPANRYQSAAEMRADLVRVLSGQRPSAPAVMSEEERTTLLGGGGATEVMGGRHRPNALSDADADRAEELAARRRKTTMVALVTALCVAVLAIAAWVTTSLLNTDPPKQEKFALPSVVNMEATQARNQLANKGFTNVREKPAPSTAEQRGIVLSMNPPADTQIGKNDPIELTVGAGPERVKVPDLSGRTPEQARQLLAEQGLQAGLEPDQEETDNAALAGKVIKQSPAPGTDVDKNSRVTFTIGRTPETVQVPQLTDMPLENARTILDSLGLTLQVQTVSSDKDQGMVVGQSPAKGTKLRKGGSVQLQVSDGSQKNKIQMPKLDGMTLDQAKRELQRAGWNGTLEPTESPTDKPSEDGKIVNQSPNPGDKIDANQRVRVVVGKFKPGGNNGGSPTTTTTAGLFGR